MKKNQRKSMLADGHAHTQIDIATAMLTGASCSDFKSDFPEALEALLVATDQLDDTGVLLLDTSRDDF
ncbi:hypothetical protein [Burkholderia multivorans]|uniref:hypothetical protein n=1 Tax=Burkholderia multivorans TaxID=87883 RepID=UPI002158B1D8|nr:hypothetical protein [Burkholderia multivorans]